jgi:hypothetical protein
VHAKSIRSQEVRALLVARKQLLGRLIDVELSIRKILRGFGLKVIDRCRFARCRLRKARGRRGQPLPSRGPLGLPRATSSRGQKMSTKVKPEKPHEDVPQTTPEWHRARAKGLRKNGFTKMAEEHEQMAQVIERRRAQQTR